MARQRSNPLKRVSTRLKHFFVAHKGNTYRPGLFARETVSIVALILLLIEGVYLVQVNFVLKNDGFLATVLPAALTTLANADRADLGLPTLTEDPELDKVAQAKAADMAAKGYFAHVSPDGKTPWYWLDKADYPYTYAGENLAVDFTDSVDVEKAWMNSPMHRTNILKQEYTHVGIGVARGMYEGKEVTFVAQFFATRRGEGAKVATAKKPQVRAADSPATQPTETMRPAETRVLGVEKTAAEMPVPDASVVAVASTSPNRAIWYLIVAFTLCVAFFFTLTLFVHSRRRLLHVEVIGGGVALIAIAGLLIMYNVPISVVQLPRSDRAASVALPL